MEQLYFFLYRNYQISTAAHVVGPWWIHIFTVSLHRPSGVPVRHGGRGNMAAILQTIFKTLFLKRDWLYFDSNSIEIQGSNWQLTNIGSDNILAMNRRKAIIWTNDCILYWRIIDMRNSDSFEFGHCKILCVAVGKHMMTSSNGNILRVTGPLSGEFTGPGELPTQRPVARSFDIFFDLHPNKRLSKQSWGWWFETLSRSLWRHRNGLAGHTCGNSCQFNSLRPSDAYMHQSTNHHRFT